MHFKDRTTKKSGHILDQKYFGVDTPEARVRDSRYLYEVVLKVKTILSSPESALFLYDIYDDEFNLNNGSVADQAIGPILYRDREDTTSYNSYGTLLDIYINFDIQKFYGLTIDEFLSKTKYERTMLVERAEKEIIKITETMSEISEEYAEGHNDE